MPTDLEGGPLARLRRGHEELVLSLLRTHGPLSRAELTRLSGLSRTTLYAIVGDLVARGALVGAAPPAEGRRRGRPVETLSLDPAAGQALGIDFARRAVHVAAVNVAHEVVGTASAAHGAEVTWAERLDLATRLVGELPGGGVRLASLSGVGVGVVGPAGAVGRAGPAPHLTPVTELLRQRFGAPVLLDTNTRLAALAEATWGAAAGVPDVAYLRLSYGVGGGLVVAGNLHRGRGGLAGEFGHITVEEDGAPCSCGKRGCLESAASLGAVLDAYPPAGDLAGLLAALPDEPAAVRAVALAGERAGRVLAAVCQALAPSAVVLGGELTATGEPLFGAVRRALDAHLMPAGRPAPDVRPARLGDAGGALGALALVLRESPPPTGPAVPVPDPTAVRRPAAAARPQGATVPVPSRGRPSWP
ncbi:putative CRP family transcriptional regulator [Streptomyces sp. Tu6071]|uniref:ROK family transcriptional regulator n=1 Tax=Streptomyces sp. Tu6071 TaxID=355249 RepID=UPI00020E5321|nr:ROK family transcriptional regulator [Streptomyces sp. Tu6071]EGJ73474.1 putative CRP family transcriptional regulator [Streptomyces sp. Tu6071]